MAAKKKSKKAKKAKSPVKKKKAAAKKKAKPVKKKSAPRKAAAKKPKKAKATKLAAKPKKIEPTIAPLPSTVPAGEERIGLVTHYFNHLSVATIELQSGELRTGDTVHVKGHTSDFYQVIDSMEVDHVHVDEVQPGTSFGLRVKDHAREHDVVYKVPRK